MVCPICTYFKTCVLTNDKAHIWNCKEFEPSNILPKGTYFILRNGVKMN